MKAKGIEGFVLYDAGAGHAGKEYQYRTILVGKEFQYVRADDLTNAITIYLSIVIGGLTVTGSAIAWGKLSEKISGKPILFAGQKWFNTAIVAAILVLGIFFILNPARYDFFLVILGLSCVFGVCMVIPIAIIANILRIIILVLLTYFFGDGVAQSFLHMAAGLFLFASSLALVFLIDHLVSALGFGKEVRDGRPA